MASWKPVLHLHVSYISDTEHLLKTVFSIGNVNQICSVGTEEQNLDINFKRSG